MTPSEKAKELHDKFFPNYSFNPWEARMGYAKKYALICVEEMIGLVSPYGAAANTPNADEIINYLLEVKAEVEKL